MSEVGSTADTPNPPWVFGRESPRVNENLTSVGFEPTTSGLDLPMLYRLSYEASTGAGRGNLGSELPISRVLRGSLTIYLYHILTALRFLPHL